MSWSNECFSLVVGLDAHKGDVGVVLLERSSSFWVSSSLNQICQREVEEGGVTIVKRKGNLPVETPKPSIY